MNLLIRKISEDVLIILLKINSLLDKMEQTLSLLSEAHSPDPNEEVFFNNKEACVFLKVSEKTLYTYRQHKEIPFNTINGKPNYSKAELIKWLKNKD